MHAFMFACIVTLGFIAGTNGGGSPLSANFVPPELNQVLAPAAHE